MVFIKNIGAIFVIICCFLITEHTYAQSPLINNYHVYYGSLHNHSNFSADASLEAHPAVAYFYAKNISKLDFLGLSEHCVYLTPQEWDSLQGIANTANEDSVFTSFVGFEWSSGIYGHMSIFNTENWTTVLDTNTNTFVEISNWIVENNGIAFFNHPGRENANKKEFMHFETSPIAQFVGMELWNKQSGFSKYYANDGYFAFDNNKGFFDEALQRGWRIGAAGSEDNHSANWGNSSKFRTAILAKANTRKDLTEALLQRRFYSTLDKNIALSFTIDSHEMGDSVSVGKLSLHIQAYDVDNEIITQVILKRGGDTLRIWTPNAKNVSIQDSLECLDGEYYYVIINQEDGDQAISSPIFVGDFSSTVTANTKQAPTNNCTLFYNTVFDKLQIRSLQSQITKVEIYTIQAVLINSIISVPSHILEVSTQTLVPGLYIVRINTVNGVESFKIQIP